MDLFKIATDKGIFVHSSAHVHLADDITLQEQTCMASLTESAGPEPLNESNRPTIMRITAWMVHEGINNNRQGFVKEELEQAAETLFEAPNFGLLDFNHSSARFFTDDPKMIGVWHKAEFAFNEKAGKWGILASGIIFSWLFPEISDILLAEQQRNGFIPVSMMAMPGSLEVVTDETGQVEIIHNPIFFAVSVLDVPAADLQAKGVSTEDSAVADDELLKQLKEASHSYEVLALSKLKLNIQNNIRGIQLKAASLENHDHEGEFMEEKVIELMAKNATAEEKIADMKSAFEITSGDLTVAKASLEALDAKVDELTTRIEEVETARDAANTERDNALTELEAIKSANEELTGKVDAFEAKEVATARSVMLKSRLDALPEEFRKVHVSRDEDTRTRLENKWMDMEDDNEWNEYVKDELLGYDVKVSFLDRSADQGVLPVTTGDSGENSIRARIARVSTTKH